MKTTRQTLYKLLFRVPKLVCLFTNSKLFQMLSEESTIRVTQCIQLDEKKGGNLFKILQVSKMLLCCRIHFAS